MVIVLTGTFTVVITVKLERARALQRLFIEPLHVQPIPLVQRSTRLLAERVITEFTQRAERLQLQLKVRVL